MFRINDGLMAIFLLPIGQELERETPEGMLMNPHDIVPPGVAGAAFTLSLFIDAHSSERFASRRTSVEIDPEPVTTLI